jgi:hypothetical protein
MARATLACRRYKPLDHGTVDWRNRAHRDNSNKKGESGGEHLAMCAPMVGRWQ